MPSFVQRSESNIAPWATVTCPGHNLAQAGDTQLLFWVSHSSIAAPTFADFTKISDTTTTHAHLVIYKKVATAANAGNGVTITNGGVQAKFELRSYRDAQDAIISGTGPGLVSLSRAVTGLLVRAVNDSTDNNSSFPPIKTLTTDPALLNRSQTAYDWYFGLAVGDDPTTSGTTAPSRTASNSPAPQFPQWADIMLTAPVPTSIDKIKLAAANVAKAYVGSSPVARIYVGSTRVK